MRVEILLAVPLLLSCTGTTGYQLVSFYAVGEGAADAQPGQPYTFTSDRFRISLTKAVLHVGAMYLDESLPTSGAAQSTCTLPGTYVGEVRAGRDIDMLDPSPQPFPILDGLGSPADGSTIPALVGQVWLSGPDVNSTAEQTAPHSILPAVLLVEGTATNTTDSTTYPFAGSISIQPGNAGSNKALPGTNAICEQRIVSQVRVDVTLSQGGTLILHLDPKPLFTKVDFAGFSAPFSKDPLLYAFQDKGTSDTDQPSVKLYENLRASGPVYRFQWQPASR
ncbi:MAG TPA: hypothetical protein VNZ26_19835 [Vicinamibacterales bacterium]|jgi:hypothetical protein|nr:hypothetical protein [Vicinamibacterales bacterium]